jgi:hypothetical protein
LGELEGPLHQDQSTQCDVLPLHTYESADQFIEFETGTLSE